MRTSIASATRPHAVRRPATVAVEGTDLLLTLVHSSPADDGRPIIGLDQFANVIAKGFLTMAEAGEISAALDDLRAQAARWNGLHLTARGRAVRDVLGGLFIAEALVRDVLGGLFIAEALVLAPTLEHLWS